MKLTKYFLIAGAALLMASCSSDDWNTNGGVSVEMAKATMSVKENAGIIDVPLQLNGTTNGPVKVTVNVAEYSASPAVEDVNYLVTSKTVTFPTDSAQVSIEISLVNDMDVNEDRAFIVTIESAEGASIGTQASTVVTITDDDGLFYEALQGKWTMYDTNWFDETDETVPLTIVGVDEGDAAYEKTLYISGWGGLSALVVEAEYNYDAATNEITLFLPYDQFMGMYSSYEIYFFGVDDGYLMDEGGAEAVVSADLRTITFDPETTVILYAWAGTSWAGGLDAYYNMVLKR